MKQDYDYPEGSPHALKTWSHDGMQFTVIKLDRPYLEHHCGYVRFETRPMTEEGYHGLLTYVPVHGGITFAEQDEDGSMVYGFDCGHAGDEGVEKLNNLEWLGEECFRMGRAIQLAAQYEDQYLAIDNHERGTVIQAYHDELKAQGIEFVLQDNFGAMINVLFKGEL